MFSECCRNSRKLLYESIVIMRDPCNIVAILWLHCSCVWIWWETVPGPGEDAALDADDCKLFMPNPDSKGLSVDI